MKFIRRVIKGPFPFAIGLLVLYFITIHIIPFWNEKFVPKCILALKFSETGITDIFIPVFLVLIAYGFFNKYKLCEELETSCHLVKAEFEANEHLMRFFEEFVLDAANLEAWKEFNENTKFCSFRHFHLDRFKLDMIHIKPNSSEEQKLNKWRSLTLQTTDLLNNWLTVYRTSEVKEADRTSEVKEADRKKVIVDHLKKKFARLRKERSGMMDIMNELLKMNKLNEIELVIHSVSQG
ncbi:MAG: hypothetical protein K940chlam9_00832 [Chlamydiae bacterium]|nr:hypothetical protein [Chlamydiota bacterium]